MFITSCSTWRKNGKQLKVFSDGDRENKIKEFHFTGYNPFPCFSMQSTFHVVEDWLKANGWERLPGGYEMIVRDTTNGRNVTINRFIPFTPAK